jgi:hypothetical protein
MRLLRAMLGASADDASSTVMRQPRSASMSATSSPTMPPPMTTTRAPSATRSGLAITSQACTGSAPAMASGRGRAPVATTTWSGRKSRMVEAVTLTPQRTGTPNACSCSQR